LRKTSLAVVLCITTVAAASLASGPAGAARAGTASGKKTIHIISDFQLPGESTTAVPYFENAAQLAVEDLEEQGWDVNYERIIGSFTSASAEEQAFLTAAAKDPDFWMGLGASNVFIPVGPKVAQSGIPTFAYSAPTEGVKEGPSGGENIYLLRPLNEARYARITDFACGNLKLERIGLSLVTTAFGPTAQQAVERAMKKYPNCEVVTAQTNSVTATDTTQQVQAFKNANVDGIISANFPGPMATQINQMRQNGLDVPYIADSSLPVAVNSNSITTGLQNLYVADDCAPDLNLNARARRFTRAYEARFNATPNNQAAQVWDAMHIAADAVARAGANDQAKVNRAMQSTDYQGLCDYAADENNVLARAIYVYSYQDDKSKKLIKSFQLPFIPSSALATTAPPTTVAPTGG
jgi:branched-chain amino acid transport system substrate-binding protein